jgi:hypothetical protein
VLTARKPSLHGVLLAANAGHTHVIVYGTLIYTDRNHAPGPRPGWTCCGRANTTITAGTSRSSPPRTAGRCGPPRCALVVSTTPPPPAPTPTCSTRSSLGRRRPARPGRPRLRREAEALRIPIKKTAGRDLTCDQQAYNAVHGALRCLGEPDAMRVRAALDSGARLWHLLVIKNLALLCIVAPSGSY